MYSSISMLISHNLIFVGFCWFNRRFSELQFQTSSIGGQRFFSFSVWAHFFSRAIAQKVLFGIFMQRVLLITENIPLGARV